MKWLGLMFIVSLSPVLAQSSPGASLRKEFDNCVYQSFSREKNRSPHEDTNLAAEVAFGACATEEQAMRAFLAVTQLAPGQIEAAISGAKMQVKRNLRAISEIPVPKR